MRGLKCRIRRGGDDFLLVADGNLFGLAQSQFDDAAMSGKPLYIVRWRRPLAG